MNKKGIEVFTVFILLAMFLSTWVFFSAANRVVTHEKFFETVSTVKLKLMKDAIDASPGNVIYQYYENIGSYEINYDAGVWGIGKNTYYSVAPTFQKKKTWDKPNQLYFGKFGETQIDFHLLDRNLKLLPVPEVPTKADRSLRVARIVVEDDTLKPIAEFIQDLLKRDSVRIAADASTSDEITIVIRTSNSQAKTINAFFALDNTLDNQQKSAKLGVLLLNQLFNQIQTLEQITLRPVLGEEKLQKANAAIILDVPQNFFLEFRVPTGQAIQAAVGAYYG